MEFYNHIFASAASVAFFLIAITLFVKGMKLASKKTLAEIEVAMASKPEPASQVIHHTGTVLDLGVYQNSAYDYIALMITGHEKGNPLFFKSSVGNFYHLPFVRKGDQVTISFDSNSGKLQTFLVDFEKRSDVPQYNYTGVATESKPASQVINYTGVATESKPASQVINHTGTVLDLRVYQNSAYDYIALMISGDEKGNPLFFKSSVGNFYHLPFVRKGDQVTISFDSNSGKLQTFLVDFEKRWPVPRKIDN
jgi:hypothetical protein